MTAYNVFKNKTKKVNKSVQSESLLSEVEPLELLLPESEELLLPLSREGPEPPFSESTDTKYICIKICIEHLKDLKKKQD